jgi:hypothetical protein
MADIQSTMSVRYDHSSREIQQEEEIEIEEIYNVKLENIQMNSKQIQNISKNVPMARIQIESFRIIRNIDGPSNSVQKSDQKVTKHPKIWRKSSRLNSLTFDVEIS